MKKLLIFGMLFALLSGCSGTKTYSEQENNAYLQLQELVGTRSLEIISNKAMPLATGAFTRAVNSNVLGPGNNAGSIDISSNANYIMIKGDSIRAFLPFFGEQHIGGGYNSNHNGIEFDNVPKDLQVRFDDHKHRADISFTMDDQYRMNEHYKIMITLYPNMSSTVRVQSSNRSSIEYTGYFHKLKEK